MADEKVVRLVPPVVGDDFKVCHAEMLDAAKEFDFTSLTIIGTLADGTIYSATSRTVAQMMLEIERAKLIALCTLFPDPKD